MGKGKVTKRERKFQASGGFKSRIKKGTITKKGKLRMRKSSNKGPTGPTGGGAAVVSREDRGGGWKPEPHRREGGTATPSAPAGREGVPTNDFLGEKNLAGLDMDSFFAMASEEIETGVDVDNRSDYDDDDHEDSEGEESESDNSSASDRSDDDDEGRRHGASKEKSASASSGSSEGDDDSDDDSGSDDEEDIEKAEARMKKQMASMERSDPSFHQFLKENEGSLLEFGDEGDDNDDDDDDDASEAGSETVGKGNERKEDDDDNVKEKKSRSNESDSVLTHKALEALLRSAFDAKGIKGLKKLVSGAYRSACHLSDSADDGAATKARPGESGVSYRIDSSKVFDDLMVSCLGRCHELFRYHLLDEPTESADDEKEVDGDDGGDTPTDETKPINPKTLESSAKWGDIRPILLSFFRSTLHLLLEAKEPKLLTLILRALAKYVPLLSPLPRVASSMLKALLQLWSAPLESSEDYQVVRLHSFLRIRQLALTQPFPFIEECMKRSYHSYASRAKFGASSSMTGLPTLTFMGNCIVELYSLDYHSAYQHAFVYIRQLALLLRGAMLSKSTDNVYCWQYVHSLKLWTAVLAAAAIEEDGTLLRSLVYPLTEVVLGTVRLSPSPRNLPLRLQCVRLLQQLAAATETFVPTAALLLDCLDYKEWYLAPKKSSSPRSLQMDATLRLPSTDKQPCLRTREQLDPAMAEIMVLLQHEVELYRYNPGFPEYAVGIDQRLRKFVRETREMRWKAFARGVMDLSERYSGAAIQGRSRLTEAPRDVRQLECLRPIDQPTMRERLQSMLDKERKVVVSSPSGGAAAAVAPSAKKGASQKRGHDDSNGVDRVEDDDEEIHAKKSKKKQKRSGNASDPKSNVAEKKQRGGGGAAGRRSAGSNVDEEDEVHEGIDWSDDED